MDIPQGDAEKVEVEGQPGSGDGAEAERERGHKASADGKGRVLKETQVHVVAFSECPIFEGSDVPVHNLLSSTQ